MDDVEPETEGPETEEPMTGPGGASVDVRIGSNLIGWGAATTSAALLEANPAIPAIWIWDAAGQQWLGDSRSLPALLRSRNTVSGGDGLFVIVAAPQPPTESDGRCAVPCSDIEDPAARDATRLVGKCSIEL